MVNNTWSNWAGNQRAVAARSAHPTSCLEVVQTIRTATADGLGVKAVGSGHSFSGAATTSGVRVHLDALTGPVHVDPAAGLVTVPAGMTLHRLNALLAGNRLALPNLGDIDRQTVAGALATGTHGTGLAFGGLATFVEGLELVTASGEVLTCSAAEHPDVFAAARIGLGALGILTQVTLRCVPAFTLRAEERPGRLADVLARLDDEVAGNDHLEFFWFPYTDRALLKRNNRVDSSDRPLRGWRRVLDDELLSNSAYGALCRLGRRYPGLAPTISRTAARALSARTYTGPSYAVFCSPRRVRFTEMEYAVPRAACAELIAGVHSILEHLPTRVLFPVEVRFSAGDDIWLSPGYGRESAYLAVHQFVGMPYEDYFHRVEALATSLGGRPHWGKLHWREAGSLAPAYPRFADFLAVRDRLDPDRVFTNSYLERVLGP